MRREPGPRGAGVPPVEVHVRARAQQDLVAVLAEGGRVAEEGLGRGVARPPLRLLRRHLARAHEVAVRDRELRPERRRAALGEAGEVRERQAEQPRFGVPPARALERRVERERQPLREVAKVGRDRRQQRLELRRIGHARRRRAAAAARERGGEQQPRWRSRHAPARGLSRHKSTKY